MSQADDPPAERQARRRLVFDSNSNIDGSFDELDRCRLLWSVQTKRRGFVGRNLIVFFDWHDTLDCARNRLKLFDQSIINKFIDLVQIARGHIEFHIVSFSGVARGRQAEEDANNLAEYCRGHGLTFQTVTVVPLG